MTQAGFAKERVLTLGQAVGAVLVVYLFFGEGWAILVAVIALLALLAPYVVSLQERHRLAAAGMPEIDRMSGEDFELKMAQLFRDKGFRVEQTRYVGDWGGDLILSQGSQRTVVQVKRWNHMVGLGAIQEVVAAKAMYGCQHALVVTNSFFTNAAVELARANGVELWDRHRLASELLALHDRGAEGKPTLVTDPTAAGSSHDQSPCPASRQRVTQAGNLAGPEVGDLSTVQSPGMSTREIVQRVRSIARLTGQLWEASSDPEMTEHLLVTDLLKVGMLVADADGAFNERERFTMICLISLVPYGDVLSFL